MSNEAWYNITSFKHIYLIFWLIRAIAYINIFGSVVSLDAINTINGVLKEYVTSWGHHKPTHDNTSWLSSIAQSRKLFEAAYSRMLFANQSKCFLLYSARAVMSIMILNTIRLSCCHSTMIVLYILCTSNIWVLLMNNRFQTKYMHPVNEQVCYS